jgi:hypothetical protein
MTILLALLTALLAQAKDNPLYTYWTGCRPGSWVLMKGEATTSGMKQQMETTQTLLSLSPEKAFVEETQKVTTEGLMIPSPPVKRDVPAREDNPDTIEQEGEETVTIGKQKFACRWIVLLQKGKSDGHRVKLWLTRDIPGGIARLELTLAGQREPGLKMTAADWLKR